MKAKKRKISTKSGDFPPCNSYIESLSRNIDSNAKSIFYLKKRAEAYMTEKDYTSALVDALKIISINKHYRRGYILATKVCLCMGDVHTANKMINQLQSVQRVITPVLTEEISELKTYVFLKANIVESFEMKNYNKSISAIDEMLKHFQHEADRLTILKAKCLVLSGKSKEARQTVEKCLEKQPGNIDAALIRACSFYHEGELTTTIEQCDQILSHNGAIKPVEDLRRKAKTLLDLCVRGKVLFRLKKYRKVVRLYKTALEIDPTNKVVTATILFNRAVALKKLRFFHGALEDFESSNELIPQARRFHQGKAECLYVLKKYPECQQECEEFLKLGHSEIVEKLMNKASKKMRKVKVSVKKVDKSKVFSLFKS